MKSFIINLKNTRQRKRQHQRKRERQRERQRFDVSIKKNLLLNGYRKNYKKFN